ncbi:MAG: hypothetical protein ACI9ES_002661, partial [Oceanospirillaceae bacterium]
MSEKPTYKANTVWQCQSKNDDQLGCGLVAIKGNFKRPALHDSNTQSTTPVVESGSSLFYLVAKYANFSPTIAAPTKQYRS